MYKFFFHKYDFIMTHIIRPLPKHFKKTSLKRLRFYCIITVSPKLIIGLRLRQMTDIVLTFPQSTRGNNGTLLTYENRLVHNYQQA